MGFFYLKRQSILLDRNKISFFISEVDSLDLSKFPAEIAKILQRELEEYAPKAFRSAMDYVWKSEEQYTPQYLKDEMDGIA